MLPEEDVLMSSTRFGLRRWFEREVSTPLDAMYARIDEHLMQDSVEEASPQAAPTARQSPASE
jgi:hypothetical protein